jgi:hypothetical protein
MYFIFGPLQKNFADPCFIPRQTGRLAVGRNIRLRLAAESSRQEPDMESSRQETVAESSQQGPDTGSPREETDTGGSHVKKSLAWQQYKWLLDV